MSVLYALILVTSLFDPPPLDLNSAGASSLADVPGLGPSRAAAIVNYRETVSGFLNVGELALVPGIGTATMEAVAPYVTVADPPPPAGTGHYLRLGPPEDTLLTVTFMDVGNGDAILLQSGAESFLIDGGPPGEPGIRAPVIHRLMESGTETIDAVLFTHPHADHIGGLPDVLQLFRPARIYDPGIDHPSPVYEHLLETAAATGCRYSSLSQGDSIRLGRGVLITVARLERSRSVNEASAVFLVEAGGFSLLVTGDIEEESIRGMTLEASPVTVVKVPHHGSRSSLFPPWSRKVSPMLAVFCVGRYNPFGHPHQSVLDDWASTGAAVLRTDLLGNIFLHTDGRTVSVGHSREAL